MQFSTATLLALLGSAAAQKVHVVSVGSPNGTLTFSPDNVKAEVGEMIQFQFRGGNHSVVQSTFDNPCSPISDHTNQTGIFSGYQLVKASEAMGMIPTYTIMVKAKTPMWLYCSQGKHCQAGMVMVVNENTAANSSRSLDNFKNIAKGEATNVGPPVASGGVAGNTTTPSTGSGSDSGSGSGSSPSATNGAGSSSTPTTPAQSSIPTAAASAVGFSSTVGLLGVVAALLML